MISPWRLPLCQKGFISCFPVTAYQEKLVPEGEALKFETPISILFQEDEELLGQVHS